MITTMVRTRCFVLLFVSVFALPARAGDPDARHWLERMSRALAEQNYEGRFFHVTGSRSETMRIIHRVERGKVSERLVSLDGSGREVIRDDKEMVVYLPDRRTVLVEKRTSDSSLLAALPKYTESLEQHYSIEKVGKVTKMLGQRTDRKSVV